MKKNGDLTEEFRNFLNEFWDEYDVDKNGELDKDEFLQFLKDTYLDENDDEDPNKQSKKIRKIHAPHSYLYKIGEYYDSTYFIKFLSENNVNTPGGGSMRTIRDHTRRISCMPKSTFRAWFCMPLAKVEARAAISTPWRFEGRGRCLSHLR